VFEQEISAPEAAMRLAMSRERVIRLVYGGVLRGRMLAGRWAIPAAEVEAYAARRESEAQPAGAA